MDRKAEHASRKVTDPHNRLVRLLCNRSRRMYLARAHTIGTKSGEVRPLAMLGAKSPRANGVHCWFLSFSTFLLLFLGVGSKPVRPSAPPSNLSLLQFFVSPSPALYLLDEEDRQSKMLVVGEDRRGETFIFNLFTKPYGIHIIYVMHCPLSVGRD